MIASDPGELPFEMIAQVLGANARQIDQSKKVLELKRVEAPELTQPGGMIPGQIDVPAEHLREKRPGTSGRSCQLRLVTADSTVSVYLPPDKAFVFLELERTHAA